MRAHFIHRITQLKPLRTAVAAAAALLMPCAGLPAEVKLAPYYSLQVLEGTSIPSKGEWMFALNLVNDLGIIVQPDPRQRFIGFYELKYTGPGFRRQEGEKFSDRLMDHVFILRHHYALSSRLQLKSQLDYMQEFKRTGTNELWGTGIYDYKRLGGGVTLDRKFSERLSGEASLQVHTLDFPNYTDLLAESQVSGETAEASTGKQNHSVYQIGVAAEYGTTRVAFDTTFMSYAKQKVIVETAQADGTFYSADLQKDSVYALSARHTRTIAKFLRLSPSVSFKMKNSNQNYQHFETATSSIPVRYFSDYYDYAQFTLAVPVSVPLGGPWSFFLAPEWELKSYSSRPPRDSDGNFVSGTQSNSLTLLSLGFDLQSNDVTRTTFFYTYQSQISNMKFERYLPYNYDGHSFGVSFNYNY